jgi:Stage II sporulation protein E (SpoIIE)
VLPLIVPAADKCLTSVRWASTSSRRLKGTELTGNDLPLEGDVNRGELMLAALLDGAHRMDPDDLAASLRRQGQLAALEGVVVYVVDRDQRQLTPLPGSDAKPEPVDGSVAGRCFQRSQRFTGNDEGSGRSWFPLLDGTARLGVMSMRLDTSDVTAVARGAALASLAAYLIIAKAAVGDRIADAFNAKPLSLAAEIRWAALPPLAFENHRIALGAMLQPAYEIAGDTFDYAVDGDTFHLAIFDAMGHGLSASLMANTAVYAYRLARRAGLSLETTYRAIDDAISQQFKDESFVTAQLATLDLATGELRSVCAGHPPPLLLRDRTSINELEADTHLPLGMGHREVAVTEKHLQGGDTLIYYSDGISEARSDTGEQFGVDRLEDVLVRAASLELTPSETARRALHSVAEHHHDELADDATLVLVHWLGPAE